MTVSRKNKLLAWPLFGSIGFIMMIVFWFLNWNLSGVRTHWGFFPMWLGFILLLNAISKFRTSTCILTHSWKHFMLLFILSAPIWWIFEFVNERVEYWIYIPRGWLPRYKYIQYATLNFSVVLPAIFSAAELCNTFKVFNKSPKFPSGKTGKKWPNLFFIFGWIMLGMTFYKPEYSMAFVWMSLFFILDPVNYHLGFSSILKQTEKGNWKIVWILWTGSMVCGFAWEMWNFYSYPKWLYNLPYLNFLYVFEMPLAGYLGYLPFSLELFAMYSLIMGLTGQTNIFAEMILNPVRKNGKKVIN